MKYDVHRAGAGDDAAFLREAAILRALSGPLAGTGVRVASYYASVPEQRALVCGLVAGRDRFAAIAAPAQRDALAQDFMAQQIRRAPCRERVCPYVYTSVVAVPLKNKPKNTKR